jgi:hypothetical protein
MGIWVFMKEEPKDGRKKKYEKITKRLQEDFKKNNKMIGIKW